MSTTQGKEKCNQCGYDEANYILDCRSCEVWGGCPRCGHEYWSKLLRNKDGTAKETKKGMYTMRYYERKGYGAMSLCRVEGGTRAIEGFTKPIPQKTIETVKQEITKCYDGYLTVWDEETKTVEDMVGRFVDFMKTRNNY